MFVHPNHRRKRAGARGQRRHRACRRPAELPAAAGRAGLQPGPGLRLDRALSRPHRRLWLGHHPTAGWAAPLPATTSRSIRTGSSASKAISSATNKSTNSWDSTFRGRLGYAYDRYLFYGTGGVAFGDIKNAGASTTKTGWTLGAGIEAALTSNVTGRLEYRHTDLGSASVGGRTVSQTVDDLMVGVGLKF